MADTIEGVVVVGNTINSLFFIDKRLAHLPGVRNTRDLLPGS